MALENTEPAAKSAAASDLSHLARWMGAAEVVGLGESVHGTHTLHRLSHRIFQHLVEEKGFEVFALEIDQAHAALLDEYVQGERDDLQALVASGWWGQKIFYDDALVSLLQWMRRYNESHPRPVRFAGYDLKQPRLAAEHLAAALAELDGGAAKRARTLLSSALAPGAFGTFPNVSGFTGTLRIPLPARRGAGIARVKVVVGGEGVDIGSVGFLLRAGSWRNQMSKEIPLGELSPARSSHALELEVPESVPALDLWLFHRGNGTVFFEPPAVSLDGRPVSLTDIWASVEPRPLMMPSLQAMDYHQKLVLEEDTGRHTLRVTADPRLSVALGAARSIEHLVEKTLRRSSEEIARERETWVRQLARLIAQAVEWRTLAEPNRDVLLAENLLWLQSVAFPGRRMLAFAHASHTERRPGRMGAFVAEALGDGYRTVSMVAGSGFRRDLGSVAEIREDAPLERLEVGQGRDSPLIAALSAIQPGSFLIRAADAEKASGTGSALSARSRPDAWIFVRQVEPLR